MLGSIKVRKLPRARATRPVAQALVRLRACAFVSGLLLTSTGRADVLVRDLARAQASSGVRAGTSNGWLGRKELSAIVELPEGADAAEAGVQRAGAHFGVVRGSLSELDALSAAHPTWRVSWSSPLRPLLDHAAVWTNAPGFRNDTGLTGKGAVVAIIDTGVDITHPDLRNADGSTRIAYLIDYSHGPAGLQPDAEEHCMDRVPCAVYGREDIDRLLKGNQAATIPGDSIGHGTHVASLAAGNGGDEKLYVGVAPDAELIIARALDSSNQISDGAVLSAASLISELAEQLGKPVVMNVSLGTNFGPHDGTSGLERGLASLVGDAHPGRAIVVATGNSAVLYNARTAFPAPLGVHTDVSVPDGTSARVPIYMGDTTSGTLFVWIAFRHGDELGVGVERTTGTLAPVQGPGQSGTFGVEHKLTATVVNGALQEVGFDSDADAAAVIIEGSWPKGETFALRLVGPGTASMWVEGQTGPGVGGLFPAATKESTVTIPAAHPDLVAVGATLNRTSWTDRLGEPIVIEELGGVDNPPLDSIAYFSSAGPTSDFRMKPDLVAPGAFVTGAMSRDADPRTSPASIFGEPGTCAPREDCSVVDQFHAVTSGTSMAAPIVSGAIALLFEQDPTLTTRRALTLLQAGARRPEGLVPYDAQLGAGALDLEGTLDVERAIASPIVREPAAANSFLTLGATYARPEPSFSIPAVLKVRDAQGHAVGDYDLTNLVVDVASGRITEEPTLLAPGLIRLAVAAERDTGGTELAVTVKYGGDLLAEATIPISVDVSTAREGFSARGGCSLAARSARAASGAGWLAALALTGWRGRRYIRAARTARNRGRTDSSVRVPRDSSRRRASPRRR
jgi:subtilisin family serine protease